MLGILPFGNERYKIDFGFPFRAASGTYLTRTPGVAGNRKTMTRSRWFKRAQPGVRQVLYSAGTGASNFSAIEIDALDRYCMYSVVGGVTTIWARTNARFRDPKGHYHVVERWDTPQATASARVSIEVNGVVISSFETVNYPTQNTDEPFFNSTVAHRIGSDCGGLNLHFDGPISEHIDIDGLALPATWFGIFAPGTMWKPRRFVGVVGAQGSWLRAQDASAATAAALGKDSAAIDAVHTAANNWTPNNFSATAGPNFCRTTDTPSRNVATLNPLVELSGTMANGAQSHSNPSTGTAYSVLATVPVVAELDAVYFEFIPTAAPTAGYPYIGMWHPSRPVPCPANVFPGLTAGFADFAKPRNGGFYLSTAYTGDAHTYGQNDVVKAAFRRSTGKLWLGIAGTGWFGGGDPAAGTSPYATLGTGIDFLPALITAYSSTTHMNFGWRDFTDTPPAGFAALASEFMSPTTGILSGSFGGNLDANGPDVWMGGTPATLTINGNVVTFGTHADRTASGFKLRTASSSYNNSGANTWVSTLAAPFVSATRVPNVAQVN